MSDSDASTMCDRLWDMESEPLGELVPVTIQEMVNIETVLNPIEEWYTRNMSNLDLSGRRVNGSCRAVHFWSAGRSPAMSFEAIY